jgi:hypothetical protein
MDMASKEKGGQGVMAWEAPMVVVLACTVHRNA